MDNARVTGIRIESQKQLARSGLRVRQRDQMKRARPIGDALRSRAHVAGRVDQLTVDEGLKRLVRETKI